MKEEPLHTRADGGRRNSGREKTADIMQASMNLKPGGMALDKL